MNKTAKNKKIKKFIFVLVLFYFLIPSISLVTAQNSQEKGGLEVSYPEVPAGAVVPKTTKVYLPHYIQYIYKFAVIAGGIIALLALVYGGFRYLTSVGNPAAITDARGQILAGLIGLIVIFGSYVVLYEINPDLISLELPRVGDKLIKNGIVLYNKKDCAGLGPNAAIPELMVLEEDVSYITLGSSGSVIMEGKNGDEEYPLSLYSFDSSDNLKIQLYTDENCDGYAADTLIDLEENTCHEIDRADIKCVKFIWWKPGVWVFNQLLNDRTVPDPQNLPPGWEEGKQYKVFQTSQNILPSGFTDKIKAIALVPDNDLKLDYGIILHNIYGGFMKNKGFAEIILPGHPGCETSEAGVTRCNTNKFNDISSMTVFNLPKDTLVETSSLPTVTVCREARCEKYQPEGNKKTYDVKLILQPGSGDLPDITSKVGGENMYSTDTNIVFEKSFGTTTWPEIGENIENDDSNNGISAIEIETGANYLVLLYHRFINIGGDGWVARLNNDAAILNRSDTFLTTIGMNDWTGRIVVIRTRQNN